MDNKYKGEPEDVQRLFNALDKLKKGEFVNISKSGMWREDRQRLIDYCYNYIKFKNHEGVDGYSFNMDCTIFFYE